MAAFNCGLEAEMFGSLMMLASGRSTSCAQLTQGVVDAADRAQGSSGKLAMMRPAREMSRVSTLTPALAA